MKDIRKLNLNTQSDVESAICSVVYNFLGLPTKR